MTIKNVVELDQFVAKHKSGSDDQLVKAINIKFQLSVEADNLAHHHRLDAGRMLVELRARVEKRGENWWKWQQGKFDRSRKDMEKLMRMASAANPEEAIAKDRAQSNARKEKYRNGASGRSKQPYEPEEETRTSGVKIVVTSEPTQKDDIAEVEDDLIEMGIRIVEQMTSEQFAIFMARIRRVRNEVC